MKEMVGGCCVCSDERGWPDNPLVYCDGNGCTVAVHQACYGIVTVPTGPWYCRKCESPETSKGKFRCELCPSRSGALKKADTGGWAHVVCALYIPEVRFGNVTSMEPIVLRLIPPERFTRTCYICTENGKGHRASQGACMACNKAGCKQQFHVTCAQSLGLLCEEAGNYLDNVKYCGYCQHHYSKLFTNHEVTVIAKKKGGNVKTIPPYKPVAHDSHSSESSSEKEGGASPMPGGGGTPTPHTKGSKGPGRKASQSRDSSKNTHASKAAPPSTTQPMDKKKSPSRRQSSTGDGPSTSKTSTPAPSPSHSAELSHSSKDKKSPSRRQSSTGDGTSTSKQNTPTPSPSHSADMGHSSKASGSSSERGRESSASRSTPPSASPGASKSPQTSGGVISSVASVTAASTVPVPVTSSSITTSVVQAPSSNPPVTFQESVITNTDAMGSKHTKKRKAAAAAASAAAEQAAQSNPNGSPGLHSAASGELESKHSKKRRTAGGAAPAAPVVADAVPAATESPSRHSTATVEVETKYNKKRKASSAASATVADAEKELQTTPSESPSCAICSTESHEETKHTKKRKAAAAAAAEKEKQPAAGASDGKLSQKESPSRVSAKSPSRAAATEIHEEKYTKKRKAVDRSDRVTQPVAIVSEGKISQKESPSRVSANTEAETRHMKKRKAASAAASTVSFATTEAAAEAGERAVPIVAVSESQPGTSGAQWEHSHSSNDAPVPMDAAEKIVKKPKTDSNTPPPAHYLSPPPLPPPPPPPIRSPRHRTSPMPGPSGMNPPAPMNPPSTIRSPSQHQGPTDMPAPPSPHVFHQPQKPATMESGIPAHSPHGHSQRSNWGGLNVAYEMHPDPNKPSVSGVAGSGKDHSGIPMPAQPMPPMTPAMRNKKRAAMSAATMTNPPQPPAPSPIQMASTSSQSLAGVRRHASLPQSQPMYQETVMESPPVSPNTERHLKAKAEQHRMLATAPHMLGNELNPDSGAAARLQEQLNAELAAHAVGGAGPDPIVPPPLINKAAPGSSGRSSGAQSLDQLLERQWEQGSQFLMEQAQHFDIASLLSCLHQLRTENVRLEEHVSNLLQRRDHLLAVNARLAIPLNSGGVTDSSYQLTFQAAASAEPPRCPRDSGPPSRAPVLDQPRCSRDSGPPIRPPPPPARPAETLTSERDRHAERAQVAQQVSHQMLMREVQQKPS